MLKIVICDSSENYMAWLTGELEHIISQRGYDMQISLVTDTSKKIYQHIKNETDMVLYMFDISNDGINGIELAKSIRKNDRESYIVFNTINADYIKDALEGLIRPSGFFIKPIKKSDLVTLLGDIYRDYLNLKSNCQSILNINIGSEIYRVDYSNIVYFEAFQKKLYIHTHNQRIGYYDSLTSLEDKLDSNFVRCHRSYIINKEKVRKVCFSQMTVEMENGAIIKMSRTYKNSVKEKL